MKNQKRKERAKERKLHRRTAPQPPLGGDDPLSDGEEPPESVLRREDEDLTREFEETLEVAEKARRSWWKIF